jgi:hypothetical protein
VRAEDRKRNSEILLLTCEIYLKESGMIFKGNPKK